MSKHLQTVAAMACMKSLLMIFNFVFWVSRNLLKTYHYKYTNLAPKFATKDTRLIATPRATLLILFDLDIWDCYFGYRDMDGGGALQVHGNEYGVFRYRSLRFDRYWFSYNFDWIFGLLLHCKGPTCSSLRCKFLIL